MLQNEDRLSVKEFNEYQRTHECVNNGFGQWFYVYKEACEVEEPGWFKYSIMRKTPDPVLDVPGKSHEGVFFSSQSEALRILKMRGNDANCLPSYNRAQRHERYGATDNRKYVYYVKRCHNYVNEGYYYEIIRIHNFADPARDEFVWRYTDEMVAEEKMKALVKSKNRLTPNKTDNKMNYCPNCGTDLRSYNNNHNCK